MLVFWKEKLVLLALPKTGTSALEAALRLRADMAFENPPDIKHIPAFRYHRFLKPLFGKIDGNHKLETMVLVREPVSWLSSWYRYRGRSELDGHRNSTADISFDSFVEAYLSDPQPAFASVGSPRKFVSNGQGKVAVTHIFQYEQLELAAEFLQKRLGNRIALKSTNVSPPRALALSRELHGRLISEKSEEFQLWQRAQKDI